MSSSNMLRLIRDSLVIGGERLDLAGESLEVRPLVDDSGELHIGDGEYDMDVKVFLGSTSEYVLFDVGNSQLTLVGVPLVCAAVTFTAATITTLTTDEITNATEIIFDIGGTDQIKVTNGTIQPITNEDIDLGTVAKYFQTLYAKTGVFSSSITLSSGSATPALAATLGNQGGLQIRVYDETVELTNAVATDTTLAVPAGAVIISAQVNLEATITGDGSGDNLLVKVGLGISSGDEDAYGVTADLVQNTKINTIPDWSANSGETLALFGMKADGTTAASEKFTGGTGQDVRVRVAYLVNDSLANV